MRTAAVVFSLCLLVLQGGFANPLTFPKMGEYNTDDYYDSTTDYSRDYTTPYTTHTPPKEIPTLPPVVPRPDPPPRPPTTVIVVVHPSKPLPSSSQLPFNPISVAANMLKPIATWPLMVAGQTYELPLQGWETFKNIVDGTVKIPKELMDQGEKAVDGLFSTIGKL